MSGPACRIRVTGRRQFKRCRRQFLYGSVRGLRPRAVSPNLAVGQSLHSAMATYYKLRDNSPASGNLHDLQEAALVSAMETWDEQIPWEVASTWDDQIKYYENVELLQSMVRMYTAWCFEHDDWDEILGVEHPMQVRTTDGTGNEILLTGTADLIGIKRGELWVVDHKTASQFSDEAALYLDDQMTAYTWMAREVFPEHRIGGVIYSQIRKKIPSVPTPIQSGKRLSKTVKDTTYDIYMQAILDNGFDPADYEEELQAVKHNEFIQQVPIIQSNYRLDQFEMFLRDECEEIVRTLKTGRFFPNPTWDCARYCDFYPLCRVSMENGDTEFLEDQMYIIDEERVLNNGDQDS
jgi:hypothetical protein